MSCNSSVMFANHAMRLCCFIQGLLGVLILQSCAVWSRDS